MTGSTLWCPPCRLLLCHHPYIVTKSYYDCNGRLTTHVRNNLTWVLSGRRLSSLYTYVSRSASASKSAVEPRQSNRTYVIIAR